MLIPIAQDEKFDVLDKNGRYLISNYGRCYSIKTNRFMKPNINNNGYARVDIFDKFDNKAKTKVNRKQVFLHIAVVEHFGDCYGNTFDKMEKYIDILNIDHRNRNKTDNRQANLQIVSAKVNQQRKYVPIEDIDKINDIFY